MRHVTYQQARSALRRGVVIEQMLSQDLSGGTFSWLEITPSALRYVLRCRDTADDGADDLMDVYEFRSVIDGDEQGRGRVLGEFADVDAVLEAAASVGARPDRWVNQGVMQDEYADLRKWR